MTTQIITHKRGATFSLSGFVKLPADSTWNGSCSVKTADGTLVEPLSVNLQLLVTPDADGNTHSILIEGTADEAADWPIEKLRCDVKFTSFDTPPLVEYSPTFVVDVVQEVTA